MSWTIESVVMSCLLSVDAGVGVDAEVEDALDCRGVGDWSLVMSRAAVVEEGVSRLEVD